MNRAKNIEDMSFPGSDLHKLKGEFAGYWAIRVSGNYRIIFRFIDDEISDIDYIDYH
jgi:proteic killer suppression protein